MIRSTLLSSLSILAITMMITFVPIHAQDETTNAISQTAESTHTNTNTIKIGVLSNANVFNRYWRTEQYNRTIPIAQAAFDRLSRADRREDANKIRQNLNKLKNMVNDNFDKDLNTALNKVLETEKLSVIMRGNIMVQTEGVIVVDVSDMVISLLNATPDDAPDVMAILREGILTEADQPQATTQESPATE